MNHDALLAHPQRRRVYDAIGANPGISPSVLARRLGIHYSAMNMHLFHLADAHLVHEEQVDRRLLLFRHDASPALRRRAPQLAALLQLSRFRVAHALEETPGVDTATLARRVRLTQKKAAAHIQRLRELGLVDDQDGLRPTPGLSSLLEAAGRILQFQND